MCIVSTEATGIVNAVVLCAVPPSSAASREHREQQRAKSRWLREEKGKRRAEVRAQSRGQRVAG
jgi:hypothetical protein